MSDDRSRTPLASFAAKWSEAYPEFGLALRFDRGPAREAHAAFACLVFELEHAAFGIREAQPAAIKLQWWAEELARVSRGEARHPLTLALADRIRDAAAPAADWHEAIAGAWAQRDPLPAPDRAALLDGYARLYAPLARIESALFGAQAGALAGSMTQMRALREVAALPDALRDGKLPLPLDLLARHRLARSNLAEPSVARGEAASEFLIGLAEELLDADAHRRIGTLRAVLAAANGERARRAARADDPISAIRAALARLSIGDVWRAWAAARRSRT